MRWYIVSFTLDGNNRMYLTYAPVRLLRMFSKLQISNVTIEYKRDSFWKYFASVTIYDPFKILVWKEFKLEGHWVRQH
jgi:hypothetical protein